MFGNILNLFKKKNDNEDEKNNKNTAKERLHLVLMQDRANVSADFLDMMKQEIIDVIKKYIDVDENQIDVKLTNKMNGDGTTGAPALYANIPIKSLKNEIRINSNKATFKEENNVVEQNNEQNNEIDNETDNTNVKQDEKDEVDNIKAKQDEKDEADNIKAKQDEKDEADNIKAKQDEEKEIQDDVASEELVDENNIDSYNEEQEEEAYTEIEEIDTNTEKSGNNEEEKSEKNNKIVKKTTFFKNIKTDDNKTDEE